MKHLSSRLPGYTTLLFGWLAACAILIVGISEATAFEQWADCTECHGGFLSDPYVSLSDGSDWGDSLHDVHREDMLNSDCDVCHTAGDRSPVFLDSSAGGSGLSAISCVGCHGRDEDMGHDGISPGRGAGLRQHHNQAGVESCQQCHDDADPGSYTPVGEDVLPNYYASPGSNHPQMPKNSCNPSGTENFAGTALGLDNDGDGTYDTADSNCMGVSTYTVGGNVSGLTGDGLALQNNGADTLAIMANGAFTFATSLNDGAAYAVTVSTQPTGQTCSVTNGSGTVAAANVTNVSVVCEDSGTPTFEINAGLNDVWYNPATDGQGFLMAAFTDSEQMFVAWYTYDTERPPEDVTAILGDPGARWLTALGPYTGDTANLTLYLTEGGVFDAADPPAVIQTDPPYGTMIIEFSDCVNALVTFEIPSLALSGEIPIERIAPDNIALCEMLSGQ